MWNFSARHSKLRQMIILHEPPPTAVQIQFWSFQAKKSRLYCLKSDLYVKKSLLWDNFNYSDQKVESICMNQKYPNANSGSELLKSSLKRLFAIGRIYLQLPLRQWGADNVYLLVLSSWKVNIAKNPIAVLWGCRYVRAGLFCKVDLIKTFWKF